MKIVAQRSKYASVKVDNKLINEIEKGLVLLVSFTHTDTESDIDYLVKKVANIRIFDDENGVMNKSILDVNGSILSISQFTLYANTLKGNRPSYVQALGGSEAIKLYNLFNEKLNKIVETKTGIFGADMEVTLTNDGPVTIILESK